MKSLFAQIGLWLLFTVSSLESLHNAYYSESYNPEYIFIPHNRYFSGHFQVPTQTVLSMGSGRIGIASSNHQIVICEDHAFKSFKIIGAGMQKL